MIVAEHGDHVQLPSGVIDRIPANYAHRNVGPVVDRQHAVAVDWQRSVNFRSVAIAASAHLSPGRRFSCRFVHDSNRVVVDDLIFPVRVFVAAALNGNFARSRDS